MNTALRAGARRLLILVALVATALLAVRSAIGPYRLPVLHTLVNSPFHAESVFWFALLGLLWFRCESGGTSHPTESAPGQFPVLLLAIALAIVALAFIHNLADPFLSDDYIILSPPPFHWNTYVVALHSPGGDGSWRPLGVLYYQLLIALAGSNPILWHLAGLALHLLNAALVFVIAWQLWRDRTAATVASLVFGLHGTRPEAALWTAGNFDLLACACVLGSISLFLSTRTEKVPGILLLVAAGICFKESAYAMPLIAFWILWSQRRLRSFGRILIAACCVCAVLFAWRWHLFHGPGGYLDPATGQPAIMSLHPLTAAKAVFVRVWGILLTPVNWDAPRSWWLPIALTASMAGLAVLAGNNSGTTRRTQFCLLAATCCAVLPALHLAVIGQSGMGSRVLYLPGAPFALWLGSLTLGPQTRRRLAVTAIMLVGMAGVLEHNLSAWHKVALEARELCLTAKPGTPVPRTADGVFLFQNGFSECVAAARRAK